MNLKFKRTLIKDIRGKELRGVMSSTWQNKFATIFLPKNTDLDNHSQMTVSL